jgi:hypothetical protein
MVNKWICIPLLILLFQGHNSLVEMLFSNKVYISGKIFTGENAVKIARKRAIRHR